MIRKKYIKILIIITIFIILFNCLHSSYIYNHILETYDNCNSQKYYNTLDDLEDEVNKIHKQFEKKESDMNTSIKILHAKMKANLKEAKKAGDQSKNIQKQKASPDKLKKLKKLKH